MFFQKRPVFFILIGLLIAIFAACGTGGQTGQGSSTPAGQAQAKQETGNLVGPNLEGNLVKFPELVEKSPVITEVTLGTKYQGIAATYNLLKNPNFSIGGIGSGFTDGWRSNAWGGKRDFIGHSPGSNPPAPTALLLTPQESSGTEVMQRVQVEPDNWYYVSVWAYREDTASRLQMALSIYSQPGDVQANAHARIVTYNNIDPGKWKQTNFIIFIPPAADYSGANPYLDFRFRMDPGATGTSYITKAELCKTAQSDNCCAIAECYGILL